MKQKVLKKILKEPMIQYTRKLYRQCLDAYLKTIMEILYEKRKKEETKKSYRLSELLLKILPESKIAELLWKIRSIAKLRPKYFAVIDFRPSSRF